MGTRISISMKARALSLLALALGGCVAGPRLDTPAADPDAPAATGAPMPRTLGADETTRKTTEQLAAVGADRLDGLKPMDHSKMGHGEMEGMDHSKMPGMSGTKGSVTPAIKPDAAPPADAAATAEEMKKTAEEMKKAADEMKAKSDALKAKRGAKPPATPAPKPKPGDHSQHQQ